MTNWNEIKRTGFFYYKDAYSRIPRLFREISYVSSFKTAIKNYCSLLSSPTLSIGTENNIFKAIQVTVGHTEGFQFWRDYKVSCTVSYIFGRVLKGLPNFRHFYTVYPFVIKPVWTLERSNFIILCAINII